MYPVLSCLNKVIVRNHKLFLQCIDDYLMDEGRVEILGRKPERLINLPSCELDLHLNANWVRRYHPSTDTYETIYIYNFADIEDEWIHFISDAEIVAADYIATMPDRHSLLQTLKVWLTGAAINPSTCYL